MWSIAMELIRLFRRDPPGSQRQAGSPCNGRRAQTVACYRGRARARQPCTEIWKWRLLLPGASEPRLRLLRPQGFRSVFQTALRGLGNRSIVVVGNYGFGPIT